MKYLPLLALLLPLPVMAQTPPAAPVQIAPPSIPDQMRTIANQLGSNFLPGWAKSYEDLDAQNKMLKAENDRLGRVVDAMTGQGHVTAAPPVAQPPHPPMATETAPEPTK